MAHQPDSGEDHGYSHRQFIRPEDTDAESVPVPSRGAHLAIRQADRMLGVLKRERYDGIAGPELATLTNNPAFPSKPTATDQVSEFESAEIKQEGQALENYGLRLTGHLTPEETANYQLILSSDDQGMLFLSRDELPEHKERIAFRRTWNDPRYWDIDVVPGPESPVSLPLKLEKGRRYYVEAWLKNGQNLGHLSVAWRKEGEPMPVYLSPPIPGRLLSTPTAPQIAKP